MPSRTRTRHSPPRHALAAAALLALSLPAGAIPPETTDVGVITRAVDEREDGDRSVGRLVMTITDASQRTIERVLQSRTMRFEGGAKTLYLIESPEDVRNTGFLSIDYRDGARADDQWLYLPSLRRVTRIASSGKSGSFLGSDLTYADLTRPDLDDYDFSLVEQEVDVDGEKCWLLEARPRSARVQEETGYVKTHTWISKTKLMPIQAKHWVAEGRKLKYLKFDAVEQVDGIWTAKEISVRVVVGGAVESSTVMTLRSIRYGQAEVTEADFTERRLERGL